MDAVIVDTNVIITANDNELNRFLISRKHHLLMMGGAFLTSTRDMSI